MLLMLVVAMVGTIVMALLNLLAIDVQSGLYKKVFHCGQGLLEVEWVVVT